MKRVIAKTLFVASLVAACSSSDPTSPFGGPTSSIPSGPSSGEEPQLPGAIEYCYRHYDKTLGKGLCLCGKLVCKRAASGECGCYVDPFGADIDQIECVPGPVSSTSGAATTSRCCIGAPLEKSSLCRCLATESCGSAEEIATCDRAQLTTIELAPGNVIFDDAKYRLTAMARSEVDAWLADGRAQRQGINVFCNQP